MRLSPAIHREHLEAFPDRVFGKLIPEALTSSRIVSDEHLDKVDHLCQELALLAYAHAHRCEIVQQPSHLFQVKLVWSSFQHVSDANQALDPAGAKGQGLRSLRSESKALFELQGLMVSGDRMTDTNPTTKSALSQVLPEMRSVC